MVYSYSKAATLILGEGAVAFLLYMLDHVFDSVANGDYTTNDANDTCNYSKHLALPFYNISLIGKYLLSFRRIYTYKFHMVER